MFMHIAGWPRLAGALAAVAMLAACSKKPNGEQSAGGSVDTAVTRTTAITPAAGPGVQVTRTDAASVTKATEYQLTNENFSHFMAAADSIVALEHRDSTVRAYLNQPLADAGSTDTDAGRKWLESNTAVSNAINSAGISVPDYFVASIAIAAAERFMNDPNAAPPTPTLTSNAAFLKSHAADLDRLRTERQGAPAGTTSAR
jgi:hypothetical protein